MGYIKKRIISDVCEKYNIANNKADLIRIPLVKLLVDGICNPLKYF
jgi:hypothetical protein